MDNVCPRDVFWFCVELSPSIGSDASSDLPKGISNSQLDHVKDLLNLSAEKLVSDVCLLRHQIWCLPEKIRSILLFKAICDGRVSSVVESMKHCPYEEFKIPIPSVLKDYHVYFQCKKHVSVAKLVYKRLKEYDHVVSSTIYTFLSDIVLQNCSSSRLKILDLGSIPVSCDWLIDQLRDFIRIHERLTDPGSCYYRLNPKDIKSIKDIGKKAARGSESVPKTPNLSHEYFLKCSIYVPQNDKITKLKECLASLKPTNLRIIFSGVYFLNVFYNEKEIQDFLRDVSQDTKLLSIISSDFYPRLSCLMDLMRNFKFRNLKYLNVSKWNTSYEPLGSEFLSPLSQLTSLKRLVLKDIKLTGNLSRLVCEFRQQKYDPVMARNCCLAHSGSLEYLDVSGCKLKDNDLNFLEQLSYNRSLKYLDIGRNFLPPTHSTCETLLLLGPSLLVLLMDHCFVDELEYNSETFPLTAFTKLRVFSFEGRKDTRKSSAKLYAELRKMENLKYIKLDDLCESGWLHIHPT